MDQYMLYQYNFTKLDGHLKDVEFSKSVDF